jgi:uncharacterized protein YhdP
VQKRARHPINKWMAATLDGVVEQTGAVFEAKFMLPWAFTEEGAADKHMAQLQHNIWVINARAAVLSIITGGGKWVQIKISADPLYQHLLDGREEVLALRTKWRAPSSVRRRSSQAAARGRQGCRHEHLQPVGRSGRDLFA